MKWRLKVACFKALSGLLGGTAFYRQQYLFDLSPLLDQELVEHLAELERIPVAACFQKYSREDLAAKHLFFVAQKQ